MIWMFTLVCSNQSQSIQDFFSHLVDFQGVEWAIYLTSFGMFTVEFTISGDEHHIVVNNLRSSSADLCEEARQDAMAVLQRHRLQTPAK